MPQLDFKEDVVVEPKSLRSSSIDRVGFEFSIEDAAELDDNVANGVENAIQFYSCSETGMDYNIETSALLNSSIGVEQVGISASDNYFETGASATWFVDLSGDYQNDYQSPLLDGRTVSFEPFVKCNIRCVIVECNFSTRELKIGFGTPSPIIETGVKLKSTLNQITNDPVFLFNESRK